MPKFDVWSPSNWVTLIAICVYGNGCGFVTTAPTGNCFGYKTPIKEPIRLKIYVWYPNTRVSIMNNTWCGLAIVTPTGSCFVIKAN